MKKVVALLPLVLLFMTAAPVEAMIPPTDRRLTTNATT